MQKVLRESSEKCAVHAFVKYHFYTLDWLKKWVNEKYWKRFYAFPRSFFCPFIPAEKTSNAIITSTGKPIANHSILVNHSKSNFLSAAKIANDPKIRPTARSNPMIGAKSSISVAFTSLKIKIRQIGIYRFSGFIWILYAKYNNIPSKYRILQTQQRTKPKPVHSRTFKTILQWTWYENWRSKTSWRWKLKNRER